MSYVSLEEFSKGMRQFCGGVTLITTRYNDEPYGLTATAVNSLCAEPPRLLACVNRNGVSYDAISKSRIFCINVLSTNHVELAMRFAGMTGDIEEDRFNAGDWIKAVTGAPVLRDAMVSFDCEVEFIIETGTHGIVVGNIMSVNVIDMKPLLYMDGAFLTINEI